MKFAVLETCMFENEQEVRIRSVGGIQTEKNQNLNKTNV